MKKAIVMFAAAAMLLCTHEAKAQKVEKFGIFNHVAVGVTAGTAGIGFDVAAPCTEYLQVRAGGQFFPKIGFNFDLTAKEISGLTFVDNTSQKVKFNGDLAFNSGKVLFDIFPFPHASSFHLTAGFYFGNGDILSIKNAKDGVFLPWIEAGKKYGVDFSDYILYPNETTGNVEAGIHVNNFRPYVGLGFGRAVPRKRVGFMFEAGVQFWGSPTVYVDGEGGRKDLTVEKIEGVNKEAGGFAKTLSKITIYPTITFRLCGRIF